MPRPVSQGDGVLAEWNPWLAELSDDEGPGQKGSGALVAAPDEAGALVQAVKTNASTDWAAFNSKQKSKALKWFGSSPGDRLIVIVVSLCVGIQFVRACEHLAADCWQHAALAKGGVFTARVLEAAGGSLAAVVAEVLQKVSDPRRWSALRPLGRTVGNSALAFSMVFATECALDQLALRSLSGLPWLLFALISLSDEVIRKIKDTPQCLWDECSKQCFDRFPTEAHWRSGTCRAILMSMAIFLRFEICRIECRHSYLRKFALATHTWRPLLAEISAKYLMLRARLLEHWLKLSTDSEKVKQTKKRGVRRKGKYAAKRSSGGGSQTACFFPLASWQALQELG